MSETPVTPKLRARARALWEAAGSPPDREDDYLERAKELAAMESNPEAGLEPNPLADGVVTPAERGQPVEEASLLDNLGEFPGSRRDQGRD
ncbi:hypothetical protein GCM10008171_06920 [Methylopila jiangsuensis]|uniref:DUF2934 domain-containing protein n=1 Tax=Methylopila jiangsuensis TaxID=586230 RepID=A0A9W6JFR1_9HYPH|nr:DUF2934 domain-containing protein [Methylopila jiangsuensis]MDR6285679.1 hypothetical protein [Methylopila jiangsuensis]GLK75438.1 hypothetical protein GCM10008171_06920 [Methylopila jiangsuensis]